MTLALRAGPERMTMTYVTELLLVFPIRDAGDVTAKAMSRAYLTALEDLPAWAVARAKISWLKGQHGEGRENYAFAPSPPQLRRLAEFHMREIRELHSQIERLLNAEVEPDYSTEHCAHMLDRLNTEVKQIGGSTRIPDGRKFKPTPPEHLQQPSKPTVDISDFQDREPT